MTIATGKGGAIPVLQMRGADTCCGEPYEETAKR
jgi:hypothetical protein